MNVVITGATSFIGKKLIKEYEKSGNKVYAVIRKQSSKKEFLKELSRRIQLIELDMDEYGRIREYIDVPCDVLYSLAWDGTRGKYRYDEIRQQKNYQYSMELIKQSHMMGCKICVLAGSQAEYGRIDGVISEETECNPTTAYGKYKLKLYREAFRYCTLNNIRIYEPRFFSLYGEGDYENTLVSMALRKMFNNEFCEFTESTQYWNYLYIDDAINAMKHLVQKKPSSGVYNIASNDTRILKDYILEMHQITNSKSELKFGNIPYELEGKVSIQPSIRKIKATIDWEPEISFEEGIHKIIMFMRRIKDGNSAHHH